MNEPRIILVSFGLFEKDFVMKVAEAVSGVYHATVISEESRSDLSPFYNPGRRQYDGNKLLEMMTGFTDGGERKAAGLFRVDLFIPILTYIFGQAMLGGDAAIASTYRLRNELYGLKNDDQAVLDRFIKEVIHEIGHTYGLIHCQVPGCVMQSGTYVENIDQKGFNLCRQCRSELEKK